MASLTRGSPRFLLASGLTWLWTWFAESPATVTYTVTPAPATEGDRVRVRLGIHTGEPTVTPGGYAGLDVHRAARICSAVKSVRPPSASGPSSRRSAPPFRPQSRNANSLLIDDTLNWLKGSHSLSFGGSFTQYDIWAKDVTLIPNVSFGVLSNDPASTLFIVVSKTFTTAETMLNARTVRAVGEGDEKHDDPNEPFDQRSYHFRGVGPRSHLRQEITDAGSPHQVVESDRAQ